MLAIGYVEETGCIWLRDGITVANAQTIADIMRIETEGCYPDWILIIENDQVIMQFNMGRDYDIPVEARPDPIYSQDRDIFEKPIYSPDPWGENYDEFIT